MMDKVKYYSLKNILSKNCQYNIIFGERSNGKTYSVLEHCIKEYFNNKSQFAIIRRWREDFQGKRGATMFDALVSNDVIKRYSNGEWTGVYYLSGRWWLTAINDKGELIRSEEPIGYAFSLSNVEHDKSTSYPNVNNVLFDEFLTRDLYQNDEFVKFMNTLSTIIRQRNNVKIFMCGNTVNKSSPYFTEMGLTHVTKMKKGTIDVYEYGESGLRVAVEYADSISKKGKPSDVYFAFDNPKLHMITGGEWEMALYPHCPVKYRPKDILFTYFIKWEDNLLQCEVISVEDDFFTFIHRKTTELKDEDDLIFSTEYSPYPNHIRNLFKSSNKIVVKIAKFFKDEKVFYQDNEVGEVVRNYLHFCGSIIR